MIKCGGCGREIDGEGMELGIKFLCSRCYHMQITGPKPPRTLGSTAFLIIAAACLTAVGLAGFSLCILYLLGTGDLLWFIIFSLLMLCVVGCPAGVLVRKRNLAFLVTILYLPLGIWAYLWYLAPGAEWGFSGLTAYGGYFFFIVGIVALVFFVKDLRGLPRL